ncbi:GAF domain-containing protein [Tropicimonas sp. TH_r6]|uniref:GAF domain-containing protein n=1 Tax=Tropicimonas sp. TH_r6 TaxID=3082085 RepID=UPI0029536CBE|nr:GAF domain-containing protein [Tropicimonas sp. TH_r6]MDV7143533.1 GAF domain-containing protein [Tropicimonas sp. TH_r6]
MTALQFSGDLEVPQTIWSIDDLGLRDMSGQGSLQYITRLARRVFSVNTALIAVVEDGVERQLLVSGLGLPEAWERSGALPLSKSFSQFVLRDGSTLAVEDKDNHPLGPALRDREELPYHAYLGAPIFAPTGEVLGVLCVIDEAPRPWCDEDLAVMEDLAHCVTDALALRSALLTRQDLQREVEQTLDQTRRRAALRDSIVAAFTEPDRTSEQRLQAMLAAGCEALNMTAAAVTRVDGSHALILAQHDMRGEATAPIERDSTGSLTAHLLSGQEIVWFNDAAEAGLADRPAFDGKPPSGFIGAPLVLEGLAYGTLEFVASDAAQSDALEQDGALVRMIAMFIVTQLEVFSQIDRLKYSESALLQYILDLRAEM